MDGTCQMFILSDWGKLLAQKVIECIYMWGGGVENNFANRLILKF